MKKKSLLLFLIAGMLFATGCNRTVADSVPSENVSESTDTKETTSNDTREENQDTKAETEKNSASPQDTTKTEDTDTSKETSGEASISQNLYHVDITNISDQKYNEEGTDFLLDYAYDTLEISGDGYDKLQTAISDWQKEQDLYWQRLIEGEYEQAKEASLMENFYGYYINSKLKITRCDRQIFSFVTEESRQTGAPYTTSFRRGVNFDASTGTLLSLKDLVTDYDRFSQKAISYLLDQLKEKEGLFMEYENYVKTAFSKTQWYFSAAGITFVYNEDEIAPHAAGSFLIHLPMKEFQEYLKEDYASPIDLGYAQIPLGEPFSFTSASGKNHVLKLYQEITTDSSGYETATPYLTLDDTILPIFPEGFSSWIHENSYLIQQKDQRSLLAVQLNYESDDHSTIFLDLTDGTVKVLDHLDVEIYTPGLETIVLKSRVDVLGTYSGIRKYDLSGKHGIVPLETESKILSVYHPLTTIQELPVTTMEKEKITLPSGTVLIPISSDNESYLRVRENTTQEEYWIHFTRKDYMIHIDGISEYEYFEMLPYAG